MRFSRRKLPSLIEPALNHALPHQELQIHGLSSSPPVHERGESRSHRPAFLKILPGLEPRQRHRRELEAKLLPPEELQRKHFLDMGRASSPQIYGDGKNRDPDALPGGA